MRGRCTGGCGRTIDWLEPLCDACEREQEACQDARCDNCGNCTIGCGHCDQCKCDEDGDEPVECPDCGMELPDADTPCPDCVEPEAKACPKCGYEPCACHWSPEPDDAAGDAAVAEADELF